MTAILVAGANGFFGQRLIADLLARTDCRVLAGGRGRTDLAGLRALLPREQWERVTPCLCDLANAAQVEAAVSQAQATVCAAGPYQELPLTLLEYCLRRGVPYFDLADDRGFVRRARGLVEAHPDAPACGIGWSASPALTARLARLAAEGLESVDSLDSQIAPGARGARGAGTVYSLLDSLAKPFTVRAGGSWRRTLGWSEPRTFRFPAPIGAREGFLVDAADHDLLPALFGAARAEFRAGAESPALNRAASALSWFSGFYGVRWEASAGLFARLLSLTSFLGTDAGAVGVEARGRKEGTTVRRRACLVAERGGPNLAVFPAAALAPVLAKNPAAYRGLIPLDGWLSRAELEAEAGKRGFRLILEEEPA